MMNVIKQNANNVSQSLSSYFDGVVGWCDTVERELLSTQHALRDLETDSLWLDGKKQSCSSSVNQTNAVESRPVLEPIYSAASGSNQHTANELIERVKDLVEQFKTAFKSSSILETLAYTGNKLECSLDKLSAALADDVTAGVSEFSSKAGRIEERLLLHFISQHFLHLGRFDLHDIFVAEAQTGKASGRTTACTSGDSSPKGTTPAVDGTYSLAATTSASTDAAPSETGSPVGRPPATETRVGQCEDALRLSCASTGRPEGVLLVSETPAHQDEPDLQANVLQPFRKGPSRRAQVQQDRSDADAPTIAAASQDGDGGIDNECTTDDEGRDQQHSWRRPPPNKFALPPRVIRAYRELCTIQKSLLEDHDVRLALQWFDTLTGALKSGYSDLIYSFLGLQFLGLLRESNPGDAEPLFDFFKTHLATGAEPSASPRKKRIVSQLMGCVAFCGHLEDSPYSDLYSDKAWKNVTKRFTRAFCNDGVRNPPKKRRIGTSNYRGTTKRDDADRGAGGTEDGSDDGDDGPNRRSNNNRSNNLHSHSRNSSPRRTSLSDIGPLPRAILLEIGGHHRGDSIGGYRTGVRLLVDYSDETQTEIVSSRADACRYSAAVLQHIPPLYAEFPGPSDPAASTQLGGTLVTLLGSPVPSSGEVLSSTRWDTEQQYYHSAAATTVSGAQPCPGADNHVSYNSGSSDKLLCRDSGRTFSPPVHHRGAYSESATSEEEKESLDAFLEDHFEHEAQSVQPCLLRTRQRRERQLMCRNSVPQHPAVARCATTSGGAQLATLSPHGMNVADDDSMIVLQESQRRRATLSWPHTRLPQLPVALESPSGGCVSPCRRVVSSRESLYYPGDVCLGASRESRSVSRLSDDVYLSPHDGHIRYVLPNVCVCRGVSCHNHTLQCGNRMHGGGMIFSSREHQLSGEAEHEQSEGDSAEDQRSATGLQYENDQCCGDNGEIVGRGDDHDGLQTEADTCQGGEKTDNVYWDSDILAIERYLVVRHQSNYLSHEYRQQ
eukprot:Lankesteria_metandrocarpae@DN5368_c0_g1_i5.p1